MEPLLPAGGAQPRARPRWDAGGWCHGAQRAWGEAKALSAVGGCQEDGRSWEESPVLPRNPDGAGALAAPARSL